MRIALSGAVLMGAAIALFASPAQAVVGEITVTDAGQEFPDATVSLQFDDGDKVVAQEDEKRPGTYIFILPEERASETATLTIMKGDKTFTDRLRIADGAPKTFPGGPGFTLTRNVGGPPVQQAKGAPGAERGRVPRDKFGLSVSGGRSTFNLPRGAFWRLENLGVITRYPVFVDNDTTSGTSANADLSMPWFGAMLGYRHADASSHAAENQINAGAATLGLFTPGNGFAAAGGILTDITTHRNYYLNGGELSFAPWPIALCEGMSFDPYFGFEGGSTEMDIDLSMTVNGALRYDEMRSVDNDYYGLFGGGRFHKPLDTNAELYADGRFNVRYNNANAMWNVALEGFNPRMQNFSKDEVTVGGQLKVGVGFRVAHGVQLYAEGSGDIYQVPSIDFTDITQGDGGAALKFNTATAWGVQAGVRVTLADILFPPR